jgi:ankyrin repeat protein
MNINNNNPELISSKDGDGNRPLHMAAFAGRKDVAELPPTNGAEVNSKDDNGWTPLLVAAGGKEGR